MSKSSGFRAARRGWRGLASAAAFCGLSLAASAAQAVTVNTYSFSQDGYVSALAGGTGTLSGTFTGVVENDSITKADLSAFHVTFTDNDGRIFSGDTPMVFAFSLIAGNSGLAFATAVQRPPLSDQDHTPLLLTCVGLAVSTYCGQNLYNGTMASYVTSNFPHIELISSENIILPPPPPVAPTPTPIPSSILLLGTATALLGYLSLHGSRAMPGGAQVPA
jgi:hypothetical protein